MSGGFLSVCLACARVIERARVCAYSKYIYYTMPARAFVNACARAFVCLCYNASRVHAFNISLRRSIGSPSIRPTCWPSRRANNR